MTRRCPVNRSPFCAHSCSMRVGEGSGEAGMGANGCASLLLGASAVIGEALGHRNALQPPAASEGERQHERILPPWPVLVIACPPPNLTEAKAGGERHGSGVHLPHLEEQPLGLGLAGGAGESRNEPAGDAVAPVGRAYPEREDLCLVGGDPTQDEAGGVGWCADAG